MGIPSSDYSDDEIDQAFEEQPILWVLKHEIKTSKGTPFEFEKRKFMIDFLNDMSPLQVLLKPPQIGASESEIVKSFFVAKKKQKDIIYTLPTDTDVVDMAGSKVNRIIAQNPILGQWVKEHDSVEQKKVGNNIIHYRGTWSKKKAMMVSSSCNIHDEVDASDLSVITDYENRLEAEESTADKWRWYFSHPSLAGHGVDVYWNKSDKKEWVITCPSCSHEFWMQWPRNIDRERRVFICHSCEAELPTETRVNGKWMPTAQGEFSGYHISQLMLYSKTASDILDVFDDPMKDEQFFYNYVLGLPYVGSENKISSEVVLKNIVKDINEQSDRIIIGVDTGLPIHYTIGNKQGIFYYGSCKAPSADYDPYDELERFLLRWPTSVIIADQGGDLIGIRRLQANYPGRVYLVYYRKDRKAKEVIKWGENMEQGIVTVDRNRMFQLMVEQLRDLGRITLNAPQDQGMQKTIDDWKPWALHFDNVYREIKVVKDSPGKDVSTNYGAELIWKRNGPDHFCHTLLYVLVGLDRFGVEGAQFVRRDNTFLKGLPVAGKADGSMPARRVLGKRLEGYVDF